MSLKIKVEMKNSSIKHTLKPMSLTHLPLSVDDLKCYILIRQPSIESNNNLIWTGTILKVILRGNGFIIQVRVEHIELIPLHYLYLVMVAPHISCLYSVDEPRLLHLTLLLGLFISLEEDYIALIFIVTVLFFLQLFPDFKGGLVQVV